MGACGVGEHSKLLDVLAAHLGRRNLLGRILKDAAKG